MCVYIYIYVGVCVCAKFRAIHYPYTHVWDWSDIFRIYVNPVGFHSKFVLEMFKIVWDVATKIVFVKTYIAYMSLWWVSPFGHQSMSTCIMAHSQHHVLDHQVITKAPLYTLSTVENKIRMTPLLFVGMGGRKLLFALGLAHSLPFGRRTRSDPSPMVLVPGGCRNAVPRDQWWPGDSWS